MSLETIVRNKEILSLEELKDLSLEELLSKYKKNKSRINDSTQKIAILEKRLAVLD